MNYDLVKIFVEKEVIKEETELYMTYKGIGLDGVANVESKGYFYVDEIKDHNHIFTFKLRDIKAGEVFYNNSENIIGVDGMTLDRFASAFDLDLNGNKVQTPPKRGRKTKEELARLASLKEEIIEEEDNEYI